MLWSESKPALFTGSPFRHPGFRPSWFSVAGLWLSGVVSPMNPANSEYPEKDFPWTFYFNGEAMPKWAACWGLAGVGGCVHPERDACEDVSERDLYIIMCTMDYVGFLRPRSILA